MSFQFGDSFDCYATILDMPLGYWDSASASNMAFFAGRFAGSQSLGNSAAVSNTVLLAKSSGSNDAVHHITVAYQQTATLTGTNVVLGLQLLDGTTGQCAIVFRTDGAILLRAGTAAGTTLATYTGAVTAINTWYGFEFEIIINNSIGRFRARKDGNTVDDFDSGAVLDTQGSANAYANKLQFVTGPNASTSTQRIDDLFWRSDASSVAWIGDVRCYTRMPASDSSVQFSRTAGSSNASCVDEAQQNALTDYAYAGTAGHEDFYNVGSIATAPLSTVAVTTRAYMIKNDAGSRTAAAQIRSGGTTVATPTLTLTTGGFQWAWRTDMTDPATSAAWTAAAVAAATPGPKVVA